jgi:hypothetical protein
MKLQETELQTSHRRACPEPRGTREPGYLRWLAYVTPGLGLRKEAEWRLMEAERLDDRALEQLSLESSGY